MATKQSNPEPTHAEDDYTVTLDDGRVVGVRATSLAEAVEKANNLDSKKSEDEK